MLWPLRTQFGDVAELVPILGVCALAAAGPFAAVRQLFKAMSDNQFCTGAFNHMHNELASAQSDDLGPETLAGPMQLRRALDLRNVSFAFPDAALPTLDEVSLRIGARTTAEVVWPPGAGKTTILDIVPGLLTPQSGALVVDGGPIDAGSVRNWQHPIGHVSPETYLGSRLIDRQSQKSTVAASAMAERKTFGHRS